MSTKKATKAKKRRPANSPPKTWNLSEVLFAFTGFLTTRKAPLIFSSRHDNAPIAEMVVAFTKANGLPDPRENWQLIKSKQPQGTEHLTNLESTNMTSPPPLEPADAVKKIARIIYEQDKKRQDLILASVLDQVKKWRQDRLDHARRQELGSQIDANTAQNDMNRLESVIRGDFAILYPVNENQA